MSGLYYAFLLARTAADAVQIASSVATIKKQNAERKAINEQRLATQAAQAASVQPKAPDLASKYDVDLFYAKVATLAYIAKSDNKITQEERNELDQALAVANNMYGVAVVANARGIFNNGSTSFTYLESYLMKVQEQDLVALIFYADEYAKAEETVLQMNMGSDPDETLDKKIQQITGMRED